MQNKTTLSDCTLRLARGCRTLVGYSILILFMSACATQQTAIKNKDGKKAEKAELSCEQLEALRLAEANKPKPVVAANAKGEKKDAEKPHYGISYGRCLPKGVIEITENFPIKPDVKAKFLKATELLEEKKYDDAIMLLKGVVGQSDQFSAPFINLGIAYARKEDYKNAETNLSKAREINPKHPVALNELGLVYRKTGRYTEARALYEELIKLYPDYLPAKKNLAVLCDIYIQDLQCALSQYEDYLLGKPDDEKVKIWVADVKSRLK